ncbi:unnamed protein product [Paramecium octaurelia]|uniref:Histidine kinase domain-containing protein n=1 Tax=Paramecium octaurelia TaxID=43137 RepID=A0A8S1WLH8_PAROT|nr:unnamed protein product [Paramecium octaurelia]
MSKNRDKKIFFLGTKGIITERKLTYQKYLTSFSIDENILLDFLSEAVIIIKFEKSEDSFHKPRVEYQNSISKVMFQKSNSDLIPFFEKISSEVFSDDSPVNPRNSLLQFQSFAQQQYKNMKRSNKYSPQQFIVTELKPNIKTGDQSLSPRLRSLTVQIISIIKLVKHCEQIFINGQKKTVEIITTIGGEDQILMIARYVMHRKNIKELLEINQSKSKILSFVSHEFKSPNDLLDLAQIKNETFSLNYKTIDIIQLGEECIHMFQLQAKQKKLQLLINANIKPLYLYTDRNRLKQIIINLIANAMKFTSKRNITIKIQQKGMLVNIGVEDTGLGISQQDQSKLFKAFGKLKEWSIKNQMNNELDQDQQLLIKQHNNYHLMDKDYK